MFLRGLQQDLPICATFSMACPYSMAPPDLKCSLNFAVPVQFPTRLSKSFKSEFCFSFSLSLSVSVLDISRGPFQYPEWKGSSTPGNAVLHPFFGEERLLWCDSDLVQTTKNRHFPMDVRKAYYEWATAVRSRLCNKSLEVSLWFLFYRWQSSTRILTEQESTRVNTLFGKWSKTLRFLFNKGSKNVSNKDLKCYVSL